MPVTEDLPRHCPRNGSAAAGEDLSWHHGSLSPDTGFLFLPMLHFVILSLPPSFRLSLILLVSLSLPFPFFVFLPYFSSFLANVFNMKQALEGAIEYELKSQRLARGHPHDFCLIDKYVL